MINDISSLNALKQQRFLAGPVIHNVCRLRGELCTVTPLHIGTGEDEDNLNRVVVEAQKAGAPVRIPPTAGDAKSKPFPNAFPYIPGTTIRGVLRSWTEAMLGPYNGENSDVASVNGMAMFDQKRQEAEQDRGDVGEPKDQCAVDRAAHDRGRALEAKDQLDLVSGLFGSTSWRAKVAILDARCIGPKDHPPENYFGRITRVAIDRDLGAADDGKLFEVEYVRPGAIFSVEIEARNVCGWELGLLLHALESFNDDAYFPTRLGAHTGHGFGQVSWKLKDVQADGWSSTPNAPKYFEAWLRRQQGERPTSINPQSFSNERRREFADVWLGLVKGG